VGERAAVAVEERAQILAGGEAAERIPRVGQRHVERVDPRNPRIQQDRALVAQSTRACAPATILNRRCNPGRPETLSLALASRWRASATQSLTRW
jgi:hypothetical protein